MCSIQAEKPGGLHQLLLLQDRSQARRSLHRALTCAFMCPVARHDRQRTKLLAGISGFCTGFLKGSWLGRARMPQVVTEAQRGKVYRALIALERHGLEQNFVNELLLVLGENEDESSLTQIHDVISRRQAWFGDKAAKVKLLRVIAEQLSGLHPLPKAPGGAAGSNSRPAALPLRTTADAEGITGKAYTTERVPFCRKLLQLALQAGVLQLQAPRQSGKTSTLQLATRQLPWLQKQHPGLKIQLIAVSMLPKETLDNALERSYPGRFPGGWRSLISKPPFTGTGNKPSARQDLHLLLIDEGQHLYINHDDFWGALKLEAAQSQSRLCVVMAAPYGMELLQGPGVQGVLSLPYKLSPRQVITLGRPSFIFEQGPPPNLHELSWAELRQLQFEQEQNEWQLSLYLSQTEYKELLTSWTAKYKLQLDDQLKQYIYELAAAQPGLVALVLDFLAESVTKYDDAHAVNIAVKYQLTSLPFWDACITLRSTLNFRAMPPGQCDVVRHMLRHGGVTSWPETMTEKQFAVARSLHAAGVLLPDESNGFETRYGFTSPIHQMVLTRQACYLGPLPTSDFEEFMQQLVLRMNPGALSSSEYRCNTFHRPLDGVHQHEVYGVATGLLPHDEDGLRAVMSIRMGQMFGARGFLDYYIGSPWCWGLDLLRDGMQQAELDARYGPDGVYQRLVRGRWLKHYAVLDFRSVSSKALFGESVDSQEASCKVLHICFTDNYKQATIRGLSHGRAVQLDVGSKAHV